MNRRDLMKHLKGIKLFFAALMFLVLFHSCWDRQGHEASGPELPNYAVSGTVFSSDTNEPVSGATVKIGDTQTTSDSTGRFSISNVLGGKDHPLVVSRTGYETYNDGFQLGFADLESLIVVLGKILYFTAQIKSPCIEPNGIVWVEGQPWSSCQVNKRMYALDEGQAFDDVKYVDSPGSFPQKDIYTIPYGITATEEGGTWYLWVSVAFDDGSAYVYKTIILPDTTLNTDTRYDTPESQYGPDVVVTLDDLATDGTYIWSCSARERRIYKHGPDMSVIETFDFLDQRPKGIAWDGDTWWMVTDNSDELFMLNGATLEPVGYYALTNAPVVGLHYRNGSLWACKHGLTGFYQTYRID